MQCSWRFYGFIFPSVSVSHCLRSFHRIRVFIRFALSFKNSQQQNAQNTARGLTVFPFLKYSAGIKTTVAALFVIFLPSAEHSASAVLICCVNVSLHHFFYLSDQKLRAADLSLTYRSDKCFSLRALLFQTGSMKLVRPLRYLIKCLSADGWTSSFIEPKLKEREKTWTFE